MFHEWTIHLKKQGIYITIWWNCSSKKNASTVERSLNHFNDGLVVAEPLFGSPCSFRLKLQDGFSCEAELIQPQVVLQPGHAGAFQRCFRCFAVCDRSPPMEELTQYLGNKTWNKDKKAGATKRCLSLVRDVQCQAFSFRFHFHCVIIWIRAFGTSRCLDRADAELRDASERLASVGQQLHSMRDVVVGANETSSG